MYQLNDTHSPSLTSWVESANGDSDFPIQNLPFAIFKRKNAQEPFRAGVAIGDMIVDMAAVYQAKLFPELQEIIELLTRPKLNEFMAQGNRAWSQVRAALSDAMQTGSDFQAEIKTCLVAQGEVVFDVPAQIGDYTDFYTSIHHATNVGKLFRPDNPLLPNYQWVPIGYHGRSSSIGVSGQCFHRPQGQLKAPDADQPALAPCKRLDYELEVGIYIGEGNALGQPIPIEQAENHVFGLCLFNDWSARDIQAWEYQPLGPFLSKSFASTVSPWIVTMEALAPYRGAWTRPADHPQPLPYLDSDSHRQSGSFDMKLEILIETQAMRDVGEPPASVAQSNFSNSYWSVAQMVTHHTVNGCNMRPGDFFGSGTMSGNTPESVGALLEATEGGKKPISLANGEQRTFLEDGDKVILRGWCEGEGLPRIGFGEAAGTVLPAISLN
ncbi:MAG: fumarylacetoacetase [Gammaproteobacteria bacterium]|nr:fumarylacetoacetase [Gammaproteobacteria bacterium]